MKRTRWGVAVLLLSISSTVAAQMAPDGQDAVRRRLVQQLQRGESLFRDDLIQDALARLYRVAPDHPEGLAAEIRLAVRYDRLEQAEALLQRLKQSAPDSAAYRSSQVLLKLTSPEGKEILAKARLYAAAGRVAEARASYDEVFGGVFPSADYELEYWRLRAREANGRPQALQALLKLTERAPEHPVLLMTVADYLFAEGQPEQAKRYLHALARQSRHREEAANREYEYLHTLPVGDAGVREWRQFADRYTDLEVGVRARERLAREQKLVEDPAWRAGKEGLALLDKERNAEALARLRRAVARYPDDPAFLGGLGLAYLRAGDRRRAISLFEAARDKTPEIEDSTKWVSLLQATRYWLLLENASKAYDRKNWTEARNLYQQALNQDPRNTMAMVGLADTLLAMGQPERAWEHYRKAFQMAPVDETARRGVSRYLATLPSDQALREIERFTPAQRRWLAELRRELLVASLRSRAEQAQAQRDLARATQFWEQAQQVDMDDPWLSFQLARSLQTQAQPARALDAYARHLDKHRGQPASHYAHALLLQSGDAWQAALDTLEQVPAQRWTADMHELKAVLLDGQAIAQATALYEQGQARAALAQLEQGRQSDPIRLQVAAWALELGDTAKAQKSYEQVLASDSNNLDARLGLLEVWLAQGQPERVHSQLPEVEAMAGQGSPNTWRRIASLWASVGNRAHARQLLEQRLRDGAGNEALVWRDLARLTAPDEPQLALDRYAGALQRIGELPSEALAPVRDDVAFTRSLRSREGDDWLRSGLRSDAEQLYQQQNPTLTVHNDYWWRSDGTPGLSSLKADTTMVHLDFPLRHGKAFLRADHVLMDAGRLETDENGIYDGRFGTCSFGAPDALGNWQSLPGCGTDLKQKARGTSVAVGWTDDRLSMDIGTTPMGFRVRNVVGGLTYKGDAGSAGWSMTLSRRPMSNSVLSFAGMKDPNTGTIWGGVVATGASLGLSWDQGLADGIWADISHHRLTGKNVENNRRTRLMGGYYRRLINKPNERLTLGLNLMYWRYDKDLGEYTLGHGGYYSPQRYTSVGLPFSYARRTANWSFVVQGSMSLSSAKSASGSYYPSTSLIQSPSSRLGISAADVAAANTFEGGKSNGVGFYISGVVERRLGHHWVAGAGVDWQHSKDYSPSRAMLYLRYTFEPWQGNLDLPPRPLIPYAEFK